MDEDQPHAIMAAAVPVLPGWAGDEQHLLLCVCVQMGAVFSKVS